MKSKLILEDGSVFEGEAFGHINDVACEVVFTTSPLGYTELLTTPSFFNKIVIMTSPIVGNNGVRLKDMESHKIWARGLIVREVPLLSGADTYDLFLDGFLREHKIMGFTGIDTRYLTKIVRKNPSMRAIITCQNLSPEEIEGYFQNTSTHSSWKEVSCKKLYSVNSGQGVKRIGVLDLGVKRSFLNYLTSLGYDLVLLPWNTPLAEILALNLDALILSDGPEDLNNNSEIVSRVGELVGILPLVGVSLGYKLLTLALGGRVKHLNPSCRSMRTPVKDLRKNTICTVVQSQTYTISGLPKSCICTLINLRSNSTEVFIDEKLKIMGMNLNPEGYPGPAEGGDLLPEFLNTI